ncbi:hypothetical protein [Marivita geojedonensis]|uniref:Uncharacterized protein n=1 Tax=Marivita geojedonensis TaxID=1123756 RepID=A0A1X4N8E6_9RHOB|nr:hypothetical protein [Marivita geojedonensis]OSQ42534.1 hypothetical protein MGEO_20470 [Marivita geojedonensis]PRY69876.1 hypothetical protein CLV76_1546 [Marivita geojedonensis]
MKIETNQNADFGYILWCTDESGFVCVDDSGEGHAISPEQFENETGHSLEDLDRAFENETPLYLWQHSAHFKVERIDVDPEQVKRDEAFADSDEAKELLKLINEAEKNGTLNALAGAYKH